nr:MAG TPA: hypothetical protein [Caudoviricetes sp.]
MSSVCGLKCYLLGSYPAQHRNTPKFLNFNIEYSGFYGSFYSGKRYFLQNNVLTPFYCVYCAIIYK